MTSFWSENQGQRCPLANLSLAVKMSLTQCSSGNWSSAGIQANSWSCLVPWASLPVGSLCFSGFAPGNKATVPSETLNCSILWLWVCPELTFTWEREQDLFRSFSITAMQIKSFLSSKGRVFSAGNSDGFIWNLNSGLEDCHGRVGSNQAFESTTDYKGWLHIPQQVVFLTINKL